MALYMDQLMKWFSNQLMVICLPFTFKRRYHRIVQNYFLFLGDKKRISQAQKTLVRDTSSLFGQSDSVIQAVHFWDVYLVLE